MPPASKELLCLSGLGATCGVAGGAEGSDRNLRSNGSGKAEARSTGGPNSTGVYHHQPLSAPRAAVRQLRNAGAAPPANDAPTLVQAALGATERLYQPGYSYHKAGVMLMELSPAGIAQGSLFVDESRREMAWRLMDAVDSLNRRFGAGTVRWAAEGLQQGWKMRSEMRSQRFTTRWDELVVAQ